MFGLMQDKPLLISSLIQHAELNHGGSEIVSRLEDGSIHRYNYSDASKRIRKLANALLRLNIKLGDRIGTLAWNTFRHFELYYAISGVGCVLHTINPRLFHDQIIYIINDAEDKIIFVDLSLFELINSIMPRLESVKAFIVMTDKESMPVTVHKNVFCYETLLENESDNHDWILMDENTACSICYTSGTTGNPKGVVFSHRSTLLHALATALPDTFNISATTVVLPVVPMFHANTWGVVYAAPLAGAKLVLPGEKLDGKSIYELIDKEKVDLLAGVPTVWLMLLNYLSENNKNLNSVNNIVIGGSAAPRAMIEEFSKKYDVNVLHAWGMTEMSPLGTVNRLLKKQEKLDEKSKFDILSKQGRPIFLVEMKITDDKGIELPRDGKSFGNLKVRSPWAAKSYFKKEGGEILDDDGWFNTGDVATIDIDGFMQITDRSKDVIKSGGEWISSIELENIAIGYEGIKEACVIGVPHAKWDERPILLIVSKEKRTINVDNILSFLEDKVPKWWLPDDIILVDSLPHTATGKLLKSELREKYKDYLKG